MISPPPNAEGIVLVVFAVIALLGVWKSAVNGMLRRVFELFEAAESELEKIEENSEDLKMVSGQLDALSHDISEMFEEVKKVKRIQRAQIKYENGSFDQEQALRDLRPDGSTLDKYKSGEDD